jgi:hypothetical protein
VKSSGRLSSQDKWSAPTRLGSVLHGERGLAQETLEIVISGHKNLAEAEIVFRREIATLVEIDSDTLLAGASNR